MDAEPLTNIVSEGQLASGRREAKSNSRSLSGWAEMWSGITYGLAILGLYYLAKVFWPGSEPLQLLFILIAASIWILGCRFSGIFSGRYDFPNGKYANLKRFVASGIGFFGLFTAPFIRDIRPRFNLSSFLVWVLVFVVGGVAGVGRRPKQT